LAMLDLGDGNVDDAVAELVTGSKAAIASEQRAILADIVDAAVIVASTTGRRADAAALVDAVETLRAQAQVTRGEPEQAELDAALRDIDLPVSVPSGPLDLSSLSDLIVGLAVS
jgi:hypothetical protein